MMSGRRRGRARVYLEHGQPVEVLTWWRLATGRATS